MNILANKTRRLVDRKWERGLSPAKTKLVYKWLFLTGGRKAEFTEAILYKNRSVKFGFQVHIQASVSGLLLRSKCTLPIM